MLQAGDGGLEALITAFPVQDECLREPGVE